MANTSSDESLASSKTQSSIMAARQICVIHNRKTPITKSARADGFLEKIEVEVVPKFTSEKASGKLPDGPRHATVIMTMQKQSLTPKHERRTQTTM